VREYGLYVDGEWVEASTKELIESIDPSNGEVVARAHRAGTRDARRAIEAARGAFERSGWPERSPEERRELLIAVLDSLSERLTELAELEARDTGLTIRAATAMVGAGIQQARELVDIAAKIEVEEPLPPSGVSQTADSRLVRSPYGVVSAITPFNAPFVLSAWKVFPALAMGNTVVHKPSPLTPATACEVAAAFDAAGCPPGVFNVLPGGGADVGEEMVSNPFVDRVAFTGSTEVGRRIAALAARTVKPVSLELGGKSANLILDDADLDVAIPGALWAVYLHQGQTCQAGTRLFVPERMLEEVVDRLVQTAAQLRVGPTLSWDTDLGPIASRPQLERVERYVGIGRKEGAVLACGGHRLADEGLQNGYYYAPTIFTGVGPRSRLAQEEVFGPVLGVVSYREEDEAVAMANDTIFGLAAAVWGTNLARASAIARRLSAGTVWVNDYHMLYAAAPYGGWRQSGLGQELGPAGCLAYARAKHLWVERPGTLRARAWTPIIGLDRVFGVDYGEDPPN